MLGADRHEPGPLQPAALRPRWSRSAAAGLLVAAGLGAALVVAVLEGEGAPAPPADPPQSAPEVAPPAAEPSPAPDGGKAPGEASPAEREAKADPPEDVPPPSLAAPPAVPSRDAPGGPMKAAERAAVEADLAEGERLLEAGDLAAARLFFRRAAERGDARGAEGMARSYDPAVLAGLPVYGVPGDPEAARRWREAARSAATGAFLPPR